MKLIENSKKEIMRAAKWYMSSASQVHKMSGYNRFWM